MKQYILPFLLGALTLFGIQSAYTLDKTIQSNYDGQSIKPDSVALATIYDTAFICAPTSDIHDLFIHKRSQRLLSAHFLGRDSINNIDYTLEIQGSNSQVSAIDLNMFPNWQAADSIEGINTRGLDSWCEVAKIKNKQ